MSRLACLALLLLAGCAKKEPAGPLRLGVAPSENLSGDPSLDWIANAVPALLAAQWEGLPEVTVVRASSRRDLVAAGAVAILCRHQIAGDLLELACWKEGAASTVRASAPRGGGLADLVTRVGQSLHAKARPAPAVSDAALRAYAVKNFLEAARLAPDFGFAYTDGASEALLAGDSVTADRLIADGLERGSGIGDIARARLYLLSATRNQNRAEQISALRQLTSLISAEPEYWQRLAQLLGAERDFAGAAGAQAKLATLRPDEPAIWNQLAYFRAWAGDAAGARSAVASYERLSPGNANAADTLGDVHYLAGEFAEAERQYLESMARDPEFLGGLGFFKAALARLRLHDAPKAGEHYRRFAEKAGPARDLLLAQWRYIALGDAMADIAQAAKSPSPDVAAAALAQMAVWQRLAGETEKANAAARQSLALARTPLARRGAQTAYFVTLPRTDAAGWRDRAEKALPDPALEPARHALTLDALIAQGDFASALPLAQKLFDQASPEQDYAPRIYLAWCLSKTGGAARAAELLRANPIPAAPVSGPFDSVLLRQEAELRKALNLP